MRVLHVFKIYYPEFYGGIQRVIFDISEGCSVSGIEARVFALSSHPRPEPFPVQNHEAVTVKQQLNIASTGISLPAFSAFRREAEQADVLHFHFPWPFMDILYMASGIKRPTILSYHSDIVKQRGLLGLYSPLMNRFLASMDHIVAASPNYVETSETLQRFRSKVKVIPYGLDPEEIEPSAEKQAYWQERLGRDFFLFLGALRYYKGLPVLLEAARKTGLKVVIGGTGNEESSLRKAAPRNVEFLGHYSDEDRAALLSLARGFVFPSNQRSEAFGVSLLEAARTGLPLICCEIGTGTTYVNRHNETGLVVPPNDVNALASAMQRLSDEPDLSAKLGAGARARFEKRFTVDRMSADYTDLYRQLAGQSSRHLPAN